ncbi:MAG: TonB-dependent receptor [Cytophagales bacterium]|nr:TonB-dependent receptor [Cytophagales bacterium]
MTKALFSILLFATTIAATAQVKGRVTDENGESLPGANVYIKDTYDGATTDLDGLFSFITAENGEQIIVISFIGFEPFEQKIDVSKPVGMNVQLKEIVNRLSGVTITAGSFEASDKKKATVLKPLDIAMTAGATADISGALNKLPGTTTNGETGRLFVRGGTANETQAFIDGVLVHNFYSASPNNVPSRSRFSPFLFKGTFFSAGGYSAEYGQALSSVLALSSNDIPDETRTDLSFMTVGTDVSHTQKWENGSIYGQVQYTDLNPYNNIIKQDIDWEDGFSSTNGTFMLRQRLSKNDMLKVYANYDRSSFILNRPSVNDFNTDHIDLVNKNGYFNTSYRLAIGSHSTGFIGLSYGATTEDILLNEMEVKVSQDSYHAKTYFTSDISNVTLKVGGEIIGTDEDEDVTLADDSKEMSDYSNTLVAGFTELDYYVTNGVTLRAGLRYSHYSIFDENTLSPRLSMAFKTGEDAQISAAYGKFHQLPTRDLLIRSHQMSYERADHYMISYQKIRNGYTFRSEIYHKEYNDLVKYDPADRFNPTVYLNSGEGYARGIDIFWRDTKTIKNVDYWVSYSYMDTKRDHRDYLSLARPTFAAGHNVSLVYKQFISSIKTQVGASYSFNSGRPYNDPNAEKFNGSRTKNYSDLSFNFAYIYKQNVILYVSATNLLGRNNVFGYEFEDEAGIDDFYESRPITQPAKRFLFVGLFITLTRDQAKNNLENL